MDGYIAEDGVLSSWRYLALVNQEKSKGTNSAMERGTCLLTIHCAHFSVTLDVGQSLTLFLGKSLLPLSIFILEKKGYE